MDTGSQHAVLLLNSLAKAMSELNSAGYELFLKTKAPSWTHPPSLSIWCGQHESGFTTGFAIQRDGTGDRSITFEILITWDASHWSIRAFVDDEDMTCDEITTVLWELPKRNVTTLDDLLQSIRESVRALIASVNDERVATSLESIEKRP